ncbi:MAG: LysR family substrate-binding domain-containing protein [Actinomycetota bacterium]|nr:LysR family substrate-binding domain-containing protein [Actinomycetota bacterium]
MGATISIGAVPALPPELVPCLLTRLAQHGPGPTAVVRAAPSGRDPAELLAGGAFDVVLVRGVVDMPGLGAVVLAREAVDVALSVEHPLAERHAVSPGDLNGVPLISFARSSDPNEFDRLYAPFLSAGLERVDLVHESHEGAVDASLRLVERNVGVSLKLASEVAAFASSAVTWRPLNGLSVEVTVSAAWRLDRMSPALHRLVQVLAGP